MTFTCRCVNCRTLAAVSYLRQICTRHTGRILKAALVNGKGGWLAAIEPSETFCSLEFDLGPLLLVNADFGLSLGSLSSTRWIAAIHWPLLATTLATQQKRPPVIENKILPFRAHCSGPSVCRSLGSGAVPCTLRDRARRTDRRCVPSVMHGQRLGSSECANGGLSHKHHKYARKRSLFRRAGHTVNFSFQRPLLLLITRARAYYFWLLWPLNFTLKVLYWLIFMNNGFHFSQLIESIFERLVRAIRHSGQKCWKRERNSLFRHCRESLVGLVWPAAATVNIIH